MNLLKTAVGTAYVITVASVMYWTAKLMPCTKEGKILAKNMTNCLKELNDYCQEEVDKIHGNEI